MVTGRRPFEGDTVTARFAAVLERDPLPLTAAAPDVPAELERIVGGCLARDPGDSATHRSAAARSRATCQRSSAAPRRLT